MLHLAVIVVYCIVDIDRDWNFLLMRSFRDTSQVVKNKQFARRLKQLQD